MPYIKKADLRELVSAGNLASNVSYNLSQLGPRTIMEHERENMRDTYKRWDKAKGILPKGLFKHRGDK